MNRLLLLTGLLLMHPVCAVSQSVRSAQDTIGTNKNDFYADLRSLTRQIEHLNTRVETLLLEQKRLQDSIAQSRDSFGIFSEPIAIIIVAFIAAIVSLLQVKANIISSARITWVENLRVATSDLISEVETLNDTLRRVRALSRRAPMRQKARQLFDQKTNEMKSIWALLFKVKLYLNRGDTNQRLFDEKLDQYTESAYGSLTSLQNIPKLEEMNQELITAAREILKEAWEDAKFTTASELLKFRFIKRTQKTSTQ